MKKVILQPPSDPSHSESEAREQVAAATPSENALQELPDPRILASLQITGQGKTLVEQNKPDDAIRILERAVSLDPSNGQNYYYLAEAWLIKNNTSQAAEFNRLAGIYLNDEDKWEPLVMQQKEKIDYMTEINIYNSNGVVESQEGF